jgi:hypothetical protein
MTWHFTVTTLGHCPRKGRTAKRKMVPRQINTVARSSFLTI